MIDISILFCIYKEPISWIKQAVQSIQKQTYGNFELLLIVDNPERLDVLELLQLYEKVDERIIVVRNKLNIGISASLNKLIGMARGKYLARMDADDISLPERLEKQYKFMEEHPTVGVCGCNVRTIDQNGFIGNKMFLYSSNIELKYSLLFYTPFVHPATFIRSELLNNEKYNTSYRVGQDTDLWLRLSTKTDFYNIQEVLFYYRVHFNNSNVYEGNEHVKYVGNRIAFIVANQVFENEFMKSVYVNFRMNNCKEKISNIDMLTNYLLSTTLGDMKLVAIILRKYIVYILRRKLFHKLFYNPFVRRLKMIYILQLLKLIYLYFDCVNKRFCRQVVCCEQSGLSSVENKKVHCSSSS